MNITFRILIDTDESVWYLLALLTLGLVVASVLAWRFVSVFAKLVEHYGNRKAVQSVPWVSGQATGQFGQVSEAPKAIYRQSAQNVPNPIPEAVLRNAPRSAGFDRAEPGAG